MIFSGSIYEMAWSWIAYAWGLVSWTSMMVFAAVSFIGSILFFVSCMIIAAGMIYWFFTGNRPSVEDERVERKIHEMFAAGKMDAEIARAARRNEQRTRT